MPKRGISLHWTISDKVAELAHQNNVAWNRVAVTLIELGIDLFRQIQVEAPTLSKELLKIRRGPLQTRRRRTVDRILEHSISIMKLNDRLAVALPRVVKANLRRQKERTGVSMSAQVRRKLQT